MKTKIFIDLDQTLFDTLKFKKILYEYFLKTGCTKEEIDNSYIDECADFKYNPEDNLRRLRTIREFDLEAALESLQDAYSSVSGCLYSDSKEFLQQIDREKYEVNLLSLGDVDFQKKKLIHCEIEQYFDNIYYCTEQKWDFLKKIVGPDEKFFLIDDRADTIMKTSEVFKDAIALKISRSDEIHDQFSPKMEFEGIEIKKLDESLEYI